MTKSKSRTLVALVGRPNVGKSTLFNMFARSRKALVENTPGLTRDRNYTEVTLNDKNFVIVDTGGFEPSTDDIMLTQMRTQTMVAIEQADILIFLGDGKTGITPSDVEIVRLLQTTDKKVFYTVNKVDSEKQEHQAVDFYGLGVEKVYPISAIAGFGVDELIDDLTEEIPEHSRDDELYPRDAVRVAVVGRPNVGKSTFINLLLGEERLVANPEPGTTRDTIDTVMKREGKNYLFIDTAGIRRRSRIVDRLEKYSVIKAFQAIDRAEIVIIMLDSREIVTDQDARIAGYAFEKGRAVIVALNKWDLIEKETNTINEYISEVHRGLKYLDHAPILTLSALTGTRAVKIFGMIDDLYERYTKRVSTGELNRFLESAMASHPPGMRRGKPIKIYYMTQVAVKPPKFMFFCNFPENIHFSYVRHLENRLREKFDFGGSPIKVVFRKRVGKLSEPHARAYAKRQRKS